MGNNTILNKLSDERIFDIELSLDLKILKIQEACDSWFCVDLNKKELLKLITELKEIADNMLENEE